VDARRGNQRRQVYTDCGRAGSLNAFWLPMPLKYRQPHPDGREGKPLGLVKYLIFDLRLWWKIDANQAKETVPVRPRNGLARYCQLKTWDTVSQPVEIARSRHFKPIWVLPLCRRYVGMEATPSEQAGVKRGVGTRLSLLWQGGRSCLILSQCNNFSRGSDRHFVYKGRGSVGAKIMG